jgi:excisionase family DNA binding protein
MVRRPPLNLGTQLAYGVAGARSGATKRRVNTDLAALRLFRIACYSSSKICSSDLDRTRNPMTPNREAVVRAEPSDASRLSELRDQIDAIFRGPHKPYLVGPNGERVDLPDSAFEALKLVIDAMARGESITLVPHGKELTSQEAADILRVSRPHLIKLLDRGELPFHRAGTHRRIKIEDVLAYRDRRDAGRKAALDELMRLSEELPGGYR